MELLSQASHPVIAFVALVVMLASVPAMLVWGLTRALTERDPMARLLDSVAEVQEEARRANRARLLDPHDRHRPTDQTRRIA